MPRDAQVPVAPIEADAAFEQLAKFDHVVLAVSGGPDSMALLVLAAEWRQRRGGGPPSLSAATVDHRLRPEASREAEFVARESFRLGLPHATLPWTDEKPLSGIPDAARQARYRLLEAHARSLRTGTVAVVTAHHLDDQAETFAMRLARGAGVTGLAAMPAERPLLEGSTVRLLRPLLPFPKSRLIATLEARGVPYVDDPTNRDSRYERARIRHALLPALEATGISAAALATSARRLGDAEAALHYAEERFTATLALSFGNEVFAAFDRDAFRKGPALLRQRLIARLIARYGGASERPELSEIEDLAARLQREEKSTATLGGAIVSSGTRFIRVWREAGRLAQSDLMLAPGESRTWDRRFVVRRAPEAISPVRVRPLGPENYVMIAGRLIPGRRPPARAVHALPSFWNGDDLVAVPSLAPFAIACEAPFQEVGCELKALALSAAY
jgi:tRNA(Ile)-lysidine synthase